MFLKVADICPIFWHRVTGLNTQHYILFVFLSVISSLL